MSGFVEPQTIVSPLGCISLGGFQPSGSLGFEVLGFSWLSGGTLTVKLLAGELGQPGMIRGPVLDCSQRQTKGKGIYILSMDNILHHLLHLAVIFENPSKVVGGHKSSSDVQRIPHQDSYPI